MKDQKALLIKCIKNDIPAFVICGNDACAIETIKAYTEIAIKMGCSREFTNDMVLVLREFEQYQGEEPGMVKLPD